MPDNIATVATKKIYKYPLTVEGKILLELPEGAEILTFQTQRDFLCIWALVNPDAPKVKREFRMYGTGHDVKEDGLKYIGTCQQFNGGLIWHLFEVCE